MTSSLLRRYSPSVSTATRSRAAASGRIAILVALAAVVACAATPVFAQDEPAQAVEEARALVEQLDADDYDERERAMTLLVEAGPAAIDPLVGRMPQGSREMIARGMYVLARLALSDETALAERSRTAIEAFAENADSPLGRQAEIALDDLDAKSLARTVARLRDLGAKIVTDVASVNGVLEESVRTVTLDENWTGTEQDLELVGRLGKATEVRLEGERFGDAAIAIVAGLDELETLTVKKAKVSARGLAPLEQAESLHTLRILYCGGDESIDAVGKLKNLSLLQLFGTKLSDEGEARLRTMFADRGDRALDIRRGGFLGVRGASIQEGALVTEVVPGSAASEAGMRAGDVIVGIDDKPVENFEQVLEHIGGYLPGRQIKFAVLRGGERLERQAALGEWD